MSDISQAKTSDTFPSIKPDRDILSAARGGGIVFAGNLFVYVTRFVIGILLARFLGAEHFGLYNLALVTATIAVGLALFGLPSALVRYVSLFASRRDIPRLWGTLQIGLGLPLILSVLAGLGLCVLADPIAERLFHEPRLAPLLRLVSLAVPFLTLNESIGAVTRGFKKMQYTVIAQKISHPIARLILIAVLVVVGLNAAGALAVHILATVMASILFLYFLNNLFSLKRPLRTAQREIREILNFSLPIYLSDLIQTFRGNLQIVLLGALQTVTNVGIFTAAMRVNLVGEMFHQSVVTASMPIVSELDGRGDRKQMRHFYQTISKWTLALNLPLFLTVLLFPVPILSIFGQSFEGGATALIILAWGNLVNTGTGICGVLLDMSGNTYLKLANSVVTVVLTLGLNILLIPAWGLIGAAVATLAAAVVVNLLRLSEVYILLRLLPYNLSFIKPLTAGLSALAVAWAARQLFHTEANLLYIFVNMILLLTVYVSVTLALGLSQDDRVVLTRLRRRMTTVLSK